MLPDSALHFLRHSSVERAVSFVGENIDVGALSNDQRSDSYTQVSSGPTSSHGSLRRSSSR